MQLDKIPEIIELDKLYQPLKKIAYVPIFEECEPEYEGSKVSGYPWLKEKQKWPKSGSSDMALTLQIFLDDLPSELNPFKDTTNTYLQLFRNEDDYLPDGKDSKIFVVNTDIENGEMFDPDKVKNKNSFTEQDSKRLKELNATGGHSTPEAKKLLKKLQKSYKAEKTLDAKAKKITGWTEIADYPHAVEIFEQNVDFPVDLSALIDDIAEKYDLYTDDIEDYLDKTYECHGGDKIGGYPSWTQGIETPSFKKEKMSYLLQLDGASGNSSFSLDGTGHLFYLPSDPQVMKFIWACT